MSQPTNGEVVAGLLAGVVNKLPGTAATIEAAQAYATLAVAAELYAIRAEVHRIAEMLAISHAANTQLDAAQD
jgi:hypothetical protein